MQTRRFVLDGLEKENRREFAGAIVTRLVQDLRVEYPLENGYQPVWDEVEGVLSISRGNFWGLEVGLVSNDSSLKKWDAKFKPFFPLVRRMMQPILRTVEWTPRPFAARALWGHLFVPLMIIPVMVAIPFIAVYRIALLVLEKDVGAAAHRLDLLWPSIQAMWPGQTLVLEKSIPILNYFLITAGTGLAATACFLMSESPGIKAATNTALVITGVVLAMVSAVFLIVLVIASLGFEIRR